MAVLEPELHRAFGVLRFGRSPATASAPAKSQQSLGPFFRQVSSIGVAFLFEFFGFGCHVFGFGRRGLVSAQPPGHEGRRAGLAIAREVAQGFPAFFHLGGAFIAFEHGLDVIITKFHREQRAPVLFGLAFGRSGPEPAASATLREGYGCVPAIIALIGQLPGRSFDFVRIRRQNGPRD